MAETPGGAVEQSNQPEQRLSVSERSARLGTRQDAVCDGKSARLSSLERSQNGQPLTDVVRKKNADDLAVRITGLKKPGSEDPLFEKPPTADRLLQLNTEIENLTKGRFSGLLVNIQTRQGVDQDATSIGMFALVDYLSAHQDPSLSDADVLKGAYMAVKEVYGALKISGDPAIAAVLIDAKGRLTSIHSKDVAVVRVGGGKGKVEISQDVDELDPHSVDMHKGEKVILCNASIASTIQGDLQSVQEIVDGLITPKVEQRVEGPITENIFYRRHVTIIPDIHGGKEMGADGRKKSESPLSDFTSGKREGEVFVTAGDVFDRGAQSWRAAQEMMEMVKKGEAVWNWGNHELLFMAAMRGDQQAFRTWVGNGGGVMINAAIEAAGGDRELGMQKLKELSTFLEQNGKAYSIVDSVLVTHAGVLADPQTGKLIDVVINGTNFGKGLVAMDAIQAEIRKGNVDVINWLANHGGDDASNKDNPFWVREQNFQEVAKDPQKAHVLREELNAQLDGGTKIELVVVGHTPSMGDVAGKTIMLDDGSTPTRFLFADTGYYEDGAPRVVRLTVPDKDPDKVVAIYLDPVSKQRPKGADGLNAVDAIYPLSGKIPERSSQGAAHGASGEVLSEVEIPHVTPHPTPPEHAQEEGEIIASTVKYENDTGRPPVKVEEYIQSPEYQQNRVWLGKVIESIQTSTDPTIEGLKQKEGEDNLTYTKRVVRALQEHLTDVGKNENTPLSRLATEAEDVSSGENPDRGGELTTLDAVAVLLDKAPGLYDQRFATPETGGNPQEVKKAFEDAFTLYQGEMELLGAKDPASLTPVEKETLARYRYTKAAYERAQKTEKWQLEVELRAHGEMPSHMISEGIPVEGILTYLQSKITQAEEAGNQEEVTKLSSLFNTLQENSRLYREIPIKDRHEKKGQGTKFKKIDELMEARQQLEANQRHLDSLRTSHNPNDQARMQEDWDQGGRDLEVRRELIIPQKKKVVQPVDLGVVFRKKGNEREILEDIAPPEPAPEIPKTEPDTSKPPVAPPPEPDITVEMEASLALATTDGYVKHNDNLTDHMMSKAETSGKHRYSRIPLLGGVIGSVLHPVQNIWRNGLAREAVREQNRRFVDRMGIIVKSHFVGSEGLDADAVRGQMRIPVEVTSELIDTSLEEGRKLLKGQSFLTRLWWGGRNAFARITTLGETSEMHFAKQWLEDKLVEDRAGKRDPVIERIYNHALDEQNAVGQRIAMNGLRRGERRVEVPDSPLATPVKGAIEAYFAEVHAAETTAQNDPEKRSRLLAEARTRLVAKVNMIGKNSSGGEIDLSQGIELASNVLSIVDDLAAPPKDRDGKAIGVKSKWQILAEQGKWNDFKINIITGESRWGGEGGETPMSKLREKVLKRMAERELFVGDGERTHGVELAIRSITSDIATYGGAFLLGAGSSAALFGARTASKIVGGLGGIMGMSAAKEMGLRIGGHEIFRGRYRGEVAQVSREVALGKKGSSEARIRGEMGKALVEPDMMEKADDVAERIEGLSAKDPKDMTEAEAYQILREVAQLDARMRIADISGTRDLQFTTQNYIIYDESQRNMQYLRLKSCVLAGLQKLTLYRELHSDFGHGEPVTSGVQIEYGRAQGTLGMFEKFSALAEAQLRVGTRAEVFKWLQDTNGVLDNNAGLGMSREDAKALMDQYYSEARGAVRQEQSIKTKERTLRRLATKRAATVVLQSALMMPIGGAIVGLEYQVLNGVVQEVQQALREGLPTWSSDWGAVITGQGASSSPLSPFQEAVLTVRHTVENVAHVETLPPHDEVIDGIHVQLPGEYKYVPGPHGTDKIVDLNGETVKDLSSVDLHIVNGKLVELDATGHIVNNDALADFRASGISIHEGSPAIVGQTEVVLNPTGGSVDQTFDGHTMHVPSGTEWIKDTQGHNDLVVVGHHDVVLIDDATISPEGIISGGQLHDGVTVDSISHTIPGGSTQEIHLLGPEGELTTKFDQFDVHTQRQSMYGGNENNGMEYHRPIYDYKETNPTTGEAVYVIQAGRGDILYPAHDPFVTFNVPQEMAEGHLYFTISVPGHGDIAIPANYSAAHDGLNDALRLDPSDTSTFVTPQGHEFTYGEVAKMFVDQGNLQGHPDGILGTEYNNIWREILHLTASDSPHSGTITSSILGDNGKLYDFGVVRGGAPLHEVITTETPDITTTESAITIGGPIEITTEGTAPTFIIDPPATVVNPIVIPLIPIPMGRENVEPVGEGEKAPDKKKASPPEKKTEEEGKTESAVEPPKKKEESENPRLTARFAQVSAPPVLNHAYVVKKVPKKPASTDLESLELAESFFIATGDSSARPNSTAAPYVFEFGDVDAEGKDRPETAQNKRYIKAEESTNGDSGVFALAAASAETPTEQAQLYKYLTESILAVHDHNPALLDKWLTAQERISQRLFIQYDIRKGVDSEGNEILRTDPNERLLVVNGDVIDNAATAALWKTRITELRQAVLSDALQEHHIRWIEFLAHSVKVPELIRLAQSTA